MPCEKSCGICPESGQPPAERTGWLRPEVAQTLDAFEACGALSHGFARLQCDHCGHDYLVAFSCKQRYFCPSCHQEKVQPFGEFVRHKVVQKMPHRQIVLTIPGQHLVRYYGNYSNRTRGGYATN